MKYYILDLTACTAEKYQTIFGIHKKIQLVRGRHEKPWDVVMDSLPQQVRANVITDRRRAYKNVTDEEFNDMLKMPIGIDLFFIPSCAKIEQVSEEEYAKAHGNVAETA